MRKNARKYIFCAGQFQYDAIYSYDPRFCFMISLLTSRIGQL